MQTEILFKMSENISTALIRIFSVDFPNIVAGRVDTLKLHHGVYGQ